MCSTPLPTSKTAYCSPWLQVQVRHTPPSKSAGNCSKPNGTSTAMTNTLVSYLSPTEISSLTKLSTTSSNSPRTLWYALRQRVSARQKTRTKIPNKTKYRPHATCTLPFSKHSCATMVQGNHTTNNIPPTSLILSLSTSATAEEPTTRANGANSWTISPSPTNSV